MLPIISVGCDGQERFVGLAREKAVKEKYNTCYLSQNLTVLYRIHGTWVNVNVGVKSAEWLCNGLLWNLHNLSHSFHSFLLDL